MDEQEPRRLDTMDEREVARILGELTSELSAEKKYELRHEDYVMGMPQFGERIRGPENMRAFQESFPGHSTQPSIQIRRVLVRDGLWVVESVIDYGGEQVSNGAAILELKDGKIWCDTRYFAESLEPPEWRAQWVERMEP